MIYNAILENDLCVALTVEWDSSKLRHFYWPLSPSADSPANKNDQFRIVPRRTDPTVSAMGR